MPSFTSNSRFPAQRVLPPFYNRWILGLLVALAVLWYCESKLRSFGHVATVSDSAELWGYHRSSLAEGKEREVALLGSSRMQVGLDDSALSALIPEFHVVQLAVYGSHSIAPFYDLAADEGFRGLIVLDTTARSLSSRIRESRDVQYEYVRFFQNEYRVTMGVESYCKGMFQEKLVVRSPELRLAETLRRAFHGLEATKPSHVRMDTDRFLSVDYSDYNRLGEIEALSEKLGRERVICPDTWASELKEVARAVNKLQSRGGRVVFVRFPVSAERWAIENRFWPREDYWDRLQSIVGGVTIHFRDHECLRDFALADHTHLDFRDSERFTEGLVSVLIEKGVLN